MLDKRSSVIAICSSPYNAIQLNERSPEQFQTIKHLNRRNPRNAIETLGNML